MKTATTPKRTRRSPQEAAALLHSVAGLKAQGLSAKDIAAHLRIQLSTINWYFDPRCKAGAA